ncbi:pyridoxal 5'-phosphate synthase [Xylanimonas oleitrophica]|uniref:Pyridoxal 5'-phosphate synthase n=1 Tax=Xylanimonas oleitrophica TaxID=2607479 RepID=A0A2W5WM05_9MICO|nr:pyridoxal 5'-phosphate synthase [Xylanimonas oleitrophica]PZR52230.1 pyridoxal 5'-phosphate synthase [Xylanimonas oleitrophica]
MSLRDRLRSLPAFPPGLPALDPATTPPEPLALFTTWFDEAVAAGASAPHATTLSTADAAGRVHARTLLLKDVTADGFWFASHARSPKGRDLVENPNASMTFFWPVLGRQVRVTGAARRGCAQDSAADFLARPEASRASGLVGRQSEPLPHLDDHAAAFAGALDRVRQDPGLVAPDWTAYVLAPRSVEFWQAREAAGPVRLRYRAGRGGGGATTWERGLLWP